LILLQAAPEVIQLRVLSLSASVAVSAPDAFEAFVCTGVGAVLMDALQIQDALHQLNLIEVIATVGIDWLQLMGCLFIRLHCVSQHIDFYVQITEVGPGLDFVLRGGVLLRLFSLIQVSPDHICQECCVCLTL
jgi:hypothetical protein